MPPASLEHLLVLTDDLEATRAFYCDALGLTVGERPPLEFPGYWLYLGDVPCVHVAERQAYAAHARTLGLDVPTGPGGSGPIDHVAFTGSDYDGIARRLEAAGVAAVRNAVPGAGMRQLFVHDPNGVRVEINVRD